MNIFHIGDKQIYTTYISSPISIIYNIIIFSVHIYRFLSPKLTRVYDILLLTSVASYARDLREHIFCRKFSTFLQFLRVLYNKNFKHPIIYTYTNLFFLYYYVEFVEL